MANITVAPQLSTSCCASAACIMNLLQELRRQLKFSWPPRAAEAALILLDLRLQLDSFRSNANARPVGEQLEVLGDQPDVLRAPDALSGVDALLASGHWSRARGWTL